MAPTYLCELLTQCQPTRSLRSSSQDLRFTPKSRLKCRGDRAFWIVDPRLQNPLPLSIRQAFSFNIFKSRLKTFLFSKVTFCLFVCRRYMSLMHSSQILVMPRCFHPHFFLNHSALNRSFFYFCFSHAFFLWRCTSQNGTKSF